MSNSCACTDDSCDCTISGNDLKRKMFADLDIPETPKPDDLLSQAMMPKKKKQNVQIEHSIPLNYGIHA